MGNILSQKTYVKAKHKFLTIILGVIAQIFLKMQYKKFDRFAVFTRKTMRIGGLGNMVCSCIGLARVILRLNKSLAMEINRIIMKMHHGD